MRSSTVALILGGFAVGLLIAELGARAAAHFRDGAPSAQSRPAVDTGTLAARIPLVHPYFGISPRRQSAATAGPIQFQLPLIARLVSGEEAGQIRTNNHGFYSTRDYPFRGQPEDYIVGIFGGSVSNYFSAVESARLARLLVERTPWRHRRVVVLNFAQNGFKQPQQALILTYFLGIGQRFDAVVNIDGFNEAALGFSENWQNGVDVSMPRAYPGAMTELFRSPTEAQVEWQSSITATRRTIARMDRWTRRLPSAAGRLVLSAVRIRAEAREARLLTERPVPASALDAGFFAMPGNPADEAEGLSRVVDGWVAGSRTMGDISAARGIAYVHILQPNQYYSEHPFGADERRQAIAEAYRYGDSVRRLYPIMRERLGELRGAGRDEVDGIGLFDRETRPVFLDNCCHYTLKGYDLLADLVAARLTEGAAARAGAP
jgi:hypothetical protein